MSPRIRGRYVKSDALLLLYDPARWLLLALSPSCTALSLVSEHSMKTVSSSTLVQLVAAGAVRVVVAVGQPGGWSLLVRYSLANVPWPVAGAANNSGSFVSSIPCRPICRTSAWSALRSMPPGC